MITDKELFIEEISEQIEILNHKLKNVRLSEKDFVRKRVDYNKLYNQQLNYIENYTGRPPMIYENVKIPTNSELYLNIQALQKENVERKIKMKNEATAIINNNYNRII